MTKWDKSKIISLRELLFLVVNSHNATKRTELPPTSVKTPKRYIGRVKRKTRRIINKLK